MNPTTYPEINVLLEELLSLVRNVLGGKLVGFYLSGSLVLGDFDKNVSDIDLTAALTSVVSNTELKKLRSMHSGFVKKHPEWDDRIEVCYISVKALKNVKSRVSTIVNISPGEPIHKFKSKKEWVMNWYLIRENGVTLFGLSPKEVIEPITREEFIQSVQYHVFSWGRWVKNMRQRRGQAAYTILTMCRALYAYKNGDQISKNKAAEWAKSELPEWLPLIRNAVKWRSEKDNRPVDRQIYTQMEKFVSFVRKIILKKSKFSITQKDERLWKLVGKTNQKILAVWAIDCAKRTLPYFEEKFPGDSRPHKALEVLAKWINTGVFKMGVIRKVSLDAHAAARDVGEDNSARSAARACGQAVATTHVSTHSIGAAVYALQAIYRASDFVHADFAVKKEREWQYKHLLKLRGI